MKDNLPKPFVPKEPVQIGQTKDGQPIWMEPKDLIPTREEEQELASNILTGREDGIIQKLAMQVLDKAARFVEQTFLKTASQEDVQIWAAGDSMGAFEWAQRAGYVAIQDGLKTVVKIRGRVIRYMDADMPKRYRESVAKRVKELIRKAPSRI